MLWRRQLRRRIGYAIESMSRMSQLIQSPSTETFGYLLALRILQPLKLEKRAV